MHFRTHVRGGAQGQKRAGRLQRRDGRARRATSGNCSGKLDELGIADDTIVMYSTDNGPHYNTWPDAGITPYRREKNTNWEGGWRVPAFVRWPGRSRRGAFQRHRQPRGLAPTLLAAAGEPDIAAKLLNGHTAGSKTFRVHLDGFDLTPYLSGRRTKARERSFCISTTTANLGDPHARLEGRIHGAAREAVAIWFEPFVPLRAPKLFNLRRDPFERADENSNTYWDWLLAQTYIRLRDAGARRDANREFHQISTAPKPLRSTWMP